MLGSWSVSVDNEKKEVRHVWRQRRSTREAHLLDTLDPARFGLKERGQGCEPSQNGSAHVALRTAL